MDRRAFLQLTLGVGGAVLLGGCTRGGGPGAATQVPALSDVTVPAPRPTLRLASPDVGFPSPFAYGPGTHGLVLYLYDTLLVGSADDGFTPWLAASFERSADGLSYAFTLRQDARWHDGTPVTAQDVAFSFEYFNTHAAELPPTVLFRPVMVTKTVVTGPLSGEIRLAAPWVAFEGEIAARFPIVPRHVWADIAEPVDVVDPALLVGSGPYRMTTFDPVNGAYLFEAYDGFWLGAPFVKRLELVQVDNELVALRGGGIDAGAPGTGTPTREVLPVFADQPKFGIVEGDPDFFVSLGWNCGQDGPAGDVAFRRACAHAIDRVDLLARLVGEGEPGNAGFLPPQHSAYHEVENYPYDPGRAAQLLDDAGYGQGAGGVRQTPDGKPLRLTLLTFPELAPAAELVRAALGKVGIELVFAPTDFFTAIVSGALNKYEMALQFFGGLERDADLLREIFSSQSQGQGLFHALGWRNSAFDALAQSQRVDLNPATRAPKLDQMQELIAAELPLLPLYYAASFLVYRREVFDQWSAEVDEKLLFVTGKASGELPIRPVTGA